MDKSTLLLVAGVIGSVLLIAAHVFLPHPVDLYRAIRKRMKRTIADDENRRPEDCKMWPGDCVYCDRVLDPATDKKDW